MQSVYFLLIGDDLGELSHTASLLLLICREEDLRTVRLEEEPLGHRLTARAKCHDAYETDYMLETIC